MIEKLDKHYAGRARHDKIAHWVGLLYRQMRWATEDGHPEVAVFTPELLDQMRADEAAIDSLMPAILTYLSRMLLEVPEVFVHRVNARLGSSYKVDMALASARFRLLDEEAA